MNQRPQYVRNPDVVLREEDPDGALLFNPDTDQIKVINQTGLLIWKMCDGSHNIQKMITALEESFEDVPGDQVSEHIGAFIDEMVGAGFIGVTEKTAQG